MKRKCFCGCGSSIEHKHKNAKFLNQSHKDRYHNTTNPRGKFSHLKLINSDSEFDEDGNWNDPSDGTYWDNSDNGVFKI